MFDIKEMHRCRNDNRLPRRINSKMLQFKMLMPNNGNQIKFNWIIVIGSSSRSTAAIMRGT